MKILVISHNVFSKTSNMGKTLASYFQGIDVEDIAQFYIHSEIPTHDICKNYYRITDKDAIKSIFTRKSGTVFSDADLRTDTHDSRTDTGLTAKLYQKARVRSPLIYLLRNLWWSVGKWNTSHLRSWLDSFNPDIVFFASGDYAFMYKIATSIAKSRKIPLVVSCMDDYYFYNKNEGRIGGRLVHNLLMNHVIKTMDYASCVYTICEKMNTDYGNFFNKQCNVLHTPATISEPLNAQKTNAISYIGNLGYKRNEQLIKIGRALTALNTPEKPECIDVYSAESRPEILADLIEENGIRFHESIPADKVLEVIGKSLAVIHTESFDEITRKSVAYSVSTKIADSLASGTCILAYGPQEVASIEYLKSNDAAFCATDENLSSVLHELITNDAERSKKITNALNLANKNHTSHKNYNMLTETLQEVLKRESITN